MRPLKYSRFLDVFLGGNLGHSQDIIVIYHVASGQLSTPKNKIHLRFILKINPDAYKVRDV